jgi:hydroxymethylpyrimidine pyrophosphatase-like HAD family hydrolase
MSCRIRAAIDAYLLQIAVAMGNAKNEIKEVAHWHVATNNEDGWAEAVNKLLQARS